MNVERLTLSRNHLRMNVERLTLLRNHLRKIAACPPRDRLFHMPVFHRYDVQLRSRDWCGTACCALGEATYVPALAAAGLTRGCAFDGVYYETEDAVSFDGRVGFEAAGRFFGLDEHLIYWLFDPNTYPHEFAKDIRPADVAKRLDMVLTGGAP